MFLVVLNIFIELLYVGVCLLCFQHLMIEKGSLWESAAETTDGQKSTMKQYGPGE
ncbi:hypothetical protein DPMN_151632 [Dreissena polymorpha]|uniref:Uncharacterized protein n=1 Tax=Dreissena polymorpha TaxID=45954 RepID=A0A9D4FGV2_DREPO|nr:hypothetical protein DPMN_151518 [Dreissena polymorpha]KAH3798042.1 hypothetical protein DPMN_151632 [Dreissena polymorpha]